jgi:hypothetical protein
MKPKNLLLTLVILFGGTIACTQAAPIKQTIASINADAQKPGGEERILKSISASTHVPVATLAKEKASTGFSYGDLYVAHSIASASGKSFNDVAKLKGQGQTWEKIADANNVSLDGKKKVTKNSANTQPKTSAKMPQQDSAYKSGGMR